MFYIFVKSDITTNKMAKNVDHLDYLSKLMAFSLLLLLCSPGYKTVYGPLLLEKPLLPFFVSLEYVTAFSCEAKLKPARKIMTKVRVWVRAGTFLGRLGG